MFRLQLEPRTVVRELLANRSLITAGVAGIVIWFLLTGTHKGQAIWVANRIITPGEAISPKDFSQAWIEATSYEAFVDDTLGLDGLTAIATIPAATPLFKSQIGENQIAGQIILSLPLEQGDPGEYPIGATAHLWGIKSGSIELLTRTAVILGSTNSNLGSARITLALPEAEEFRAITAEAVRIVLAGS